MDLLLELLKYYSKDPIEKGGTSIAGKGSGATPALVALIDKVIKPGMKVLDYGAGKYARNADYLRKAGIETFAFDPFNGNATRHEGWEPGKIATHLSLTAKDNDGKKFDVAFTCFVLNVVPVHVEKEIIKNVERLGKTCIHITRNKDVFEMTKSALMRKDKVVYPFYVNEYNDGKEVDPKDLSDKKIMDFCKFGVQTSKGF